MAVTHDVNKRQFQIQLDDSSSTKGELLNSSLRQRFPSISAYLTYELNGDTIDFQHTYVPSEYRGQGMAEKLVQNALSFVESQSSIKSIIPSCSYVAKYLTTKAPQYARYLTK